MVKLYCVLGGWDYEGSDVESLKVFSCREKAIEFGKFLVEDGYDFYNVEVREVE